MSDDSAFVVRLGCRFMFSPFRLATHSPLLKVPRSAKALNSESKFV